jgi:hypothetical protein
VGQTLLASKEDQPAFSRRHESKRGRERLRANDSKETDNFVQSGVIASPGSADVEVGDQRGGTRESGSAMTRPMKLQALIDSDSCGHGRRALRGEDLTPARIVSS